MDLFAAEIVQLDITRVQRGSSSRTPHDRLHLDKFRSDGGSQPDQLRHRNSYEMPQVSPATSIQPWPVGALLADL